LFFDFRPLTCPFLSFLLNDSVGSGSSKKGRLSGTSFSLCTGAQRRYVSRDAHEEAFERMEQRMLAHLQMMASRRPIVEHPFGNLNQWLFGNGRLINHITSMLRWHSASRRRDERMR
jgi:hypothetical protein